MKLGCDGAEGTGGELFLFLKKNDTTTRSPGTGGT